MYKDLPISELEAIAQIVLDIGASARWYGLSPEAQAHYPRECSALLESPLSQDFKKQLRNLRSVRGWLCR